MNENKKKHWQIECNRFVAYIDILGFKELVLNNSFEYLIDKFSIINNDTLLFSSPKFFDGKKIVCLHSIYFSDTIYIFSSNDSIISFKHFLLALYYYTNCLLFNNIPFTGAISHGNAYIDIEKNIFFGKPIIDSYILGEQVNYIGLVAHNSIDKYLSLFKSNDISDIVDNYLFQAKTPLKCGSITHNNLYWFNIFDIETRDDLCLDMEMKNSIDAIEDFFMTSSGSPRRYFDNTLDLMKKVWEDKKIIK
jgi:hypothetical protein